MPNNFFSRFPQISYNIDGRGTNIILTDIVKNVDVNDVIASNSIDYVYYDIIDGERPDIASFKLYGSSNYYWTFFILNNELRNGLSDAWPLSQAQLEAMIEREYDDYSVITFLPEGTSVSPLGNGGLMQLLYLWEDYIPYLRLTNEGGSIDAKILRYDRSLLQLVIYDIKKLDGNPPNSRDTFINDSRFKIKWVNPFNEITETTDWNACNALKKIFVDKTIAVYNEYDTAAIFNSNLLPEDLTQDEINEIVKNYNDSYVFSKIYLPAPTNYRWALYRNAASEYYTEVDDEVLSTSIFDILKDPNVIEPKFIPYYQYEEVMNDRKSKIKVIRKNRIIDFVNEYFNTLLNNG